MLVLGFPPALARPFCSFLKLPLAVGWGGGLPLRDLLGGSWVVISGVTSPLIWVVTIVTLLITLLITTHEPPSRA